MTHTETDIGGEPDDLVARLRRWALDAEASGNPFMADSFRKFADHIETLTARLSRMQAAGSELQEALKPFATGDRGGSIRSWNHQDYLRARIALTLASEVFGGR